MTGWLSFRSLRSLQQANRTPTTFGILDSFPRCYGPEFVAQELRQWLGKLRTGTLYIERGSPWENGYCESFNGMLRDECLNGEIFYSLKETQVVIEQWRLEYNTRRPHLALGVQAASAYDLRPTASTWSPSPDHPCWPAPVFLVHTEG